MSRPLKKDDLTARRSRNPASKTENRSLLLSHRIESRIYVFRAQKVMVDSDLAALYGTPTKTLLQAVKRNRARFPKDFMFQLSPDEYRFLRSQFVTLKTGSGRHRKYIPYAFTEQGIAMLSSVLRSPRAIHVNIEIMRTFVHLRAFLASHAELTSKVIALEKKYDGQFRFVFETLRGLLTPPEKPKHKIGF